MFKPHIASQNRVTGKPKWFLIYLVLHVKNNPKSLSSDSHTGFIQGNKE